MRYKRLLFFLSLPMLLFSCVSKKKVLTLSTGYETELSKVREELYVAKKEIGNLTLQLAERKGENNALLLMQEKLQNQIDKLEKELQRNSNQAMSQQQSLSTLLSLKDSSISVQQARIDSIGTILQESSRDLEIFAGVLRDSFQRYPTEHWEVQKRGNQIVLRLNEPLLFKPGSTSRIEQQGIAPLQSLANVLAQNPLLFVEVIGHHDNQPLPRKTLTDAWDYTVLRASTVVRTMIRDMDLSPGRILAAGKGPFEPAQSNETAAGQASNRRVEFVIFPSAEVLPRRIQQLLRD